MRGNKVCTLFSSSHPLLTPRAEKETSSPSLVRLVSEITMLGAFSPNHRKTGSHAQFFTLRWKLKLASLLGNTFYLHKLSWTLIWPLSDIHATCEAAEQAAEEAVGTHTAESAVAGGGWSSSGSHTRPWTDSRAGLMWPWPIVVLYPQLGKHHLTPVLIFAAFCLQGFSQRPITRLLSNRTHSSLYSFIFYCLNINT